MILRKNKQTKNQLTTMNMPKYKNGTVHFRKSSIKWLSACFIITAALKGKDLLPLTAVFFFESSSHFARDTRDFFLPFSWVCVKIIPFLATPLLCIVCSWFSVIYALAVGHAGLNLFRLFQIYLYILLLIIFGAYGPQQII